MYYPANFPKRIEKKLLDLLHSLEKDFKKTPPASLKQFHRLILDNWHLKIKPSNWWLYFILLRNEHCFSKRFIQKIKPYLLKTKTRSISGVIPVTVFTKGIGCPFNCVYCPTEDGLPKSYLSDEPAVMRAIRNKYDPYKQVLSRLIMFYLSGHLIEKVEIIIKGGTFSFYQKKYRTWFVKRIFDACNTDIQKIIKTGTIKSISASNLHHAQTTNEHAFSRIIGINIETRPDYINENELWYLRYLGVTHVELGVQLPDDKLYKLIKRGHLVHHVKEATQLLKDFGFKITYHMMPNLPGSTVNNDKEKLSEIFIDQFFRPDHLKLYPTTVTVGSLLAAWYKQGMYRPYSLSKLIDLLIEFKSSVVPPWVRIGRLTRDITTTSMEVQQFNPNLREIIQTKMNAENKICVCIRCREIRDNTIIGKPKLRVLSYDASNSKEYFLEFIDKADHSLGFLRLRILTHQSIIRELHIYGQAAAIGEHNQHKIQHKSYGKLLLKEAEKITKNEGLRHISIISGVGAREYYRKQGYKLHNTYMTKNI